MVLRRLRGLVAVAAALCVSAGCSDATPPEAGPNPAAESPAPAAPSSPVVPDDLPAAVAELCATYLEMAAAVAGIDSSADTDALVDELAPVMRGWAEDLVGAKRPAHLPAEVWAGVELLAERILALPDKPTYADLEAVATDLSARETEHFRTASRWFLRTCEE